MVKNAIFCSRFCWRCFSEMPVGALVWRVVLGSLVCVGCAGRVLVHNGGRECEKKREK